MAGKVGGVIAATWWHPERVIARGHGGRLPGREELQRLVDQGLTDKDIAARYQSDKAAIARRRYRVGVQRTNSSYYPPMCLLVTDTTRAILGGLQAAGLTRPEVARLTGLPEATIRRLYKLCGIGHKGGRPRKDRQL